MKAKEPKRLLIVAHRGSSGSAPENTLAAFRLAVDEGAHMIELDVRLTKDFHLVVHHDQQLKRTTNGSGFLWDKTLQELRMLDAGSWFSPRFRGEAIPTLRQVLEILPSHVNVNIEAKTDGDPRKRIHMEESCILIVLEKKFEDRVLVSSFDHRFLGRMHDLYPAIKTGALYVPVRDAAKKPSTLARRIGVSAFITSHAQLRKRHVEDAHTHNMMVGCYSVNTRRQLERVLKLGVDAVVTDFPGPVRRMIGRK